MITLTREKGNRMWGGGSASSVAFGGGGGDMSGYASMAMVDESFLSKAFWDELFIVHTSVHVVVKDENEDVIDDYTEDGVLAPNQLPGTVEDTDEETGYTTTTTTTITSIEAKVGVWTTAFMSALGLNDSGGGGGATALADLTDVSLSSPINGQALVYNATSGKWENQTIGGGGGGTLTSIGLVMPTGFSVSPTTLTADGSFTVSFANGYALPLAADVAKGVTAYGWGNHANAGYATQSWVQNQGYLTSSAISDMATKTWVNNYYLPLTGGTLTGLLSLTPAAGEGGEIHLSAPTSQTSQAGIVLDQYNSTFRIFGIASADGTTKVGTGTALVIDPYAKTITGGYTFDGTASSASRLSGTGTYTAWGQQFWANGVPATINGDMSNVGNITAKSGVQSQILGFVNIDLNSLGTLSGYGGFIDFHYNGSSADYTSRIIEDASGRIKVDAQLYIPSAKSIRIGDGLLTWDANASAFMITDYAGNPANLYALGSISALGFNSSSNSTTVDSLIVRTDLKMIDYASAEKTVISILNTQNPDKSFLAIGHNWKSLNHDTILSGYNVRIDSGSLAEAVVINNSGLATFNGYAKSARFYFDDSRYLYNNGSNLYFYNGSTSIQIA